MAVIRNFYTLEIGTKDSDSFALARDVLTDQVFVLQGQTRHEGEVGRYNEIKHNLAEFLMKTGSPQTELMELIGTLVIEE